MSTEDPYWRVKELFAEALELAPEERERFLHTACGDDLSLLREIQGLLREHERAIVETPSSTASPTVPRASSRDVDELPGTTLGPYKLLELIGRGGMGVVYKAEHQGIHRIAALKLIKLGMDTQQVIARFETERQALAVMNHPNVAAVYDVGTTASGRPFFVMEYVDGTPITTFCDKQRYTTRQRLELFAQACEAIQHAHQKAIIHRDLKPGNILVAIADGKPIVKVIDFGVAKATEQRMTEHTVFTETGHLVGTPEYMSPEQADLNAIDIDTRTDIYSLGVVLYELLAGALPFDSKRLRSAAYAQIQAIIREVDPPRPSTRLSSMVGAAAAEVAARRGTLPPALHRELRGELDWIVMKCLEKERAQRYETANGLAMDVRRYLSDEPVTAGAPSTAYRLKKFVRRNKGPVLAATTILLLLVAGVVGTTWGLIGERQARKQALAAAAAEKVAKETALARDGESRAVLEFVQNKIMAAARPQGQDGGLGHDVTLRRAVEAALPFVESSFKNQPLVEAKLRMTMGSSFWFLGDAKTAATQFEGARTLSSQLRGADHPDTLTCMTNLATMYDDLGRFTDALALREETFAAQKAMLGPDHFDTLRSMINLANSYTNLGREADALALREQTLPLVKAKLGPDHAMTFMGMNNLALSYESAGRHPDALKLREETLAVMKTKFGEEYPGLLPVMNGLATSYSEVGREDDAMKLREQTLAMEKAKLGIDHPMTLWGMNNLAISYATAGRDAEALALREEVLTRRETLLGADHPDTLDAMHNLAFSYAAVGRHTEVLNLRREVLTIRLSKLGEDHPDTMRSMKALAATYQALGRHADALELREQTLTLRISKLGPNHPDTLKVMQDVGESLMHLDRNSDALVIFDDCLGRARSVVVDPDFISKVEKMRGRAGSATRPATSQSSQE